MKVERQANSPRPWGWSLYHDGSDNLLQRPDATYGCAEDALRAGKAAHAEYEVSVLRCPVRTEEEFAF